MYFPIMYFFLSLWFSLHLPPSFAFCSVCVSLYLAPFSILDSTELFSPFFSFLLFFLSQFGILLFHLTARIGKKFFLTSFSCYSYNSQPSCIDCSEFSGSLESKFMPISFDIQQTSFKSCNCLLIACDLVQVI